MHKLNHIHVTRRIALGLKRSKVLKDPADIPKVARAVAQDLLTYYDVVAGPEPRPHSVGWKEEAD